MPHGRLNRAVSAGPSVEPDTTARPAKVQNAYGGDELWADADIAAAKPPNTQAENKRMEGVS